MLNPPVISIPRSPFPVYQTLVFPTGFKSCISVAARLRNHNKHHIYGTRTLVCTEHFDFQISYSHNSVAFRTEPVPYMTYSNMLLCTVRENINDYIS